MIGRWYVICVTLAVFVALGVGLAFDITGGQAALLGFVFGAIGAMIGLRLDRIT